MNQTEPPIDDDYETPAQADARQLLNAAAQVVSALLTDEPHETITEYGAFNQADYFEPLFASGELHEALRHMIDDPLFSVNNLRSAVRFADMRNDERAQGDRMGKYGPVVVRTRTIVKSPWTEVPYGEIDEARGR